MRKVTKAELDERKRQRERQRKEGERKRAYVDEILPLIIEHYGSSRTAEDVAAKIKEVNDRVERGERREGRQNGGE